MTGSLGGSGAGSGAAKRIAVLLLDDHEVVRRGLRDLLEAEPDIRWSGGRRGRHRILGTGPHPRAAPPVWTNVVDVRDAADLDVRTARRRLPVPRPRR